jgi:ABC-2 type transport system permease protein
MYKTMLVMKNEIITMLNRRSFLFAVFGVPLIAGLIFWVLSLLNRGGNASTVISQILNPPPENKAEGYVDESGLIKSLPASLSPNALIAYPDEAAARGALDTGKIGEYYIIPKDYVEQGKIINVRPDFNPLSGSSQSSLIAWVLQVNLLNGDTQLAARINQPFDLQTVSLSPAPQRDRNNLLSFFLPYAVTMIFYIIILGAASLLLNSVTKEKENRMLEILMVSLNPQQMMVGKIIGLGLMGLFQTIAWVGTGYLLLRLSGQTFNLPTAFQLPPSILVWGLVFFLLGYTIYASLMAGLGALVPNLREATQATFVVILPLIIPIMFISVLIEDPNGALATGLSLFPLTAPVTMMTRLSAGGVPWWQPALASLLMAITGILILRAVARMFHAQTLLSGQPFNLGLFLRALLGRTKSI